MEICTNLPLSSLLAYLEKEKEGVWGQRGVLVEWWEPCNQWQSLRWDYWAKHRLYNWRHAGSRRLSCHNKQTRTMLLHKHMRIHSCSLFPGLGRRSWLVTPLHAVIRSQRPVCLSSYSFLSPQACCHLLPAWGRGRRRREGHIHLFLSFGPRDLRTKIS